MTDNLYAPPQADMRLPTVAAGADQKFYVVSQRKFTILFLATLGLYNFYWYYTHWSRYKQQCRLEHAEGGDIWPVARAFFSLFFVHSLFSAVFAHAEAKARSLDWDYKSHATGLVVMLIASNVLNRMAESILSNAFMVLLLFAICYSERSAQRYINLSCGDPEGKSNSDFTWANYVWVALGCVFWGLIAFGLFASAGRG